MDKKPNDQREGTVEGRTDNVQEATDGGSSSTDGGSSSTDGGSSSTDGGSSSTDHAETLEQEQQAGAHSNAHGDNIKPGLTDDDATGDDATETTAFLDDKLSIEDNDVGRDAVPGKLAFLEDELSVAEKDDNDRERQQALKQLGICDRLKQDNSYRRRCIHCIWLFFAFISLGWHVGVVGPTFPDIRVIVDKDLATASWLFTTGSIGYLLGSLLGGILYDRFDKLLLIFYSVIGLAVTLGVVPWCESFPLMMVVRFIGGLASGGLDTGGNADMVSIWDEEGRPYMQALHFCFGFGGIIAPFVAEPFLAPRDCIYIQNDAENFSMLNLTMTTTDPVTVSSNTTYYADNSTNGTACVEVYGETKVQYAYLILSIMTVASAVPFLVMYIKALRKNKPHMTQADQSGKERPDKLPFKLKVTLLILLSSMMAMYCAVEDTFAGFLMTFSIEHLDWDKAKGSLATSLYWIAFSCGRFLGIFLIRCFLPLQLLFVFLILLMCSFLGLLISSVTLTTPLIWLFIPVAGFSMSIVFPCIFTWTEESILEVTGKISAMFLISASIGLMVNPLFLGNLMKHYTPLWFVYLLLSESVLVFCIFLTLLFLVKNVVYKVGKNLKAAEHPLTLVENERSEKSCFG